MRNQRLMTAASLVLVLAMVFATGAYAAPAMPENCPMKAKNCPKQDVKAATACPCPTCTNAKKDGKCDNFVDADQNGACDNCVAGVCPSQSRAKAKETKTAAPCPLHAKTAAAKETQPAPAAK